MSRRVTRSSAKLTADSSLLANPPPQPTAEAQAALPAPTTRKRKASSSNDATNLPVNQPEPSTSRKKRAKRSQPEPDPSKPTAQADLGFGMSNTERASSKGESSASPPAAAPAVSKKKAGKAKKTPAQDLDQAAAGSSGKRSRISTGKKSKKTAAVQPDPEPYTEPPPPTGDSEDEEDILERDLHDEDDSMADDPFGGASLGRPGGYMSSSSAMRALRGFGGMVGGGGASATSARLRGILENLKQYDDPSTVNVALSELSSMLLYGNDELLAGHFAPEAFLKELIVHMDGGDSFEPNPEIMNLACRCIFNMLEAIPSTAASVVYSGVLPVLVSKLLSIEYMDLAEQALLTLEKVSSEFPGPIVRAGGLSACLNFLDFFSTSVQRTAVTTAANCCRNISIDSFDTVKEVMPILLGVLRGNDQRVVENGCLCITRIVESFKYQDDKLEEIMSAEMLRAVLSLLLPGSTNMIGSHIHTQFLRLLATVARASPTLTVELFKMNIVETLYQILTGVSPPSGVEDVAHKIDSVVIMQALIHRPRDQIFETLNVICELLPSLTDEHGSYVHEYARQVGHASSVGIVGPLSRQTTNSNRLEMLSRCKPELQRFAVVLLPTLTDAYSSTVNLSVREKVLSAQMKMLSFLDIDIVIEALRLVPFSSYLASILSQQDHPNLVVAALEVAHTLLRRLESIYSSQFFREGVISEARKLSERPQQKEAVELPAVAIAPTQGGVFDPAEPNRPGVLVDRGVVGTALDDDDDGAAAEDEDAAAEDDEAHDDDDSNSSDEELATCRLHAAAEIAPDPKSIQDVITKICKVFVAEADNAKTLSAKAKAAGIMEGLQSLAADITACYDSGRTQDGANLFAKLAKYFEGDALESITSFELLTSKVVNSLLDVFQESEHVPNLAARAAFVEAFMSAANHSQTKITAGQTTPLTAFSVLVKRLQDLLSRAEHFGVITVHSNTADSDRSSAASMLAKQLRVQLVAAAESGIPKSYGSIMVSIHAIANFKSLDDYLRPRIAISELAGGGSRSDPRLIETLRAATEARRALREAQAQLAAIQVTGEASNARVPPPPRALTEASASQMHRKASRAKVPSSRENEAAEEASSSGTRKASGSRRSSRKSKGIASEADTPMPPPPIDEDDLRSAIGVADEAPLVDHDNDEMEIDNTFDSIVEGLDEELDDEGTEPSAVNLEVAATGKVNVRNDDGTRIETPTGTPGAAARTHATAALRSSRHATSTLPPSLQAAMSADSESARRLMYATALGKAAGPQDWHLEFSVNGQLVAYETTIYHAVHFNQGTHEEVSARNIWSQIHTITFKRVDGPPPSELGLGPSPELSRVSPETASGLPRSLELNPISAEILRLLRILHEMNSHVDDLVEARPGAYIQAEPLAQFVNTKLTAKLNRQLEEPLIVASNCLPSWSVDLARLYPFLFPFETRHLFLQSTSFGYSRMMSKWQSGQAATDMRRNSRRDERPFLGRLQRQKVRISRHKLLESAVKVMEMYGSSASVLEVEFFDEVGTGLGPTLEFYSNVSKEFSKKKLKLWRENESGHGDDYAFGKYGLFPAPMSEEQSSSENGKRILTLFKSLGKFVARSMLDSRIIDVSLNPTFFRLCSAATDLPLSLATLKAIDSDLAQSLQTIKQFALAKKKIDEQVRLSPMQKAQKMAHVQVAGANIQDLGLDFTLPGHSDIMLVPDGANIGVNLENVGHYLERVIDFTIGNGVKRQIEAFKTGFCEVFPYSATSAFTADELAMLCGRNDEDWSLETLMDSTKADHGYNLDSSSVRNLLQVMSELSESQRRNFLQFITGSPKLPIGGFKSLTPMFTVVCKRADPPYGPDDYLPSVMTCVNYLKLPDYSSLEVSRKQLLMAIREGQGAFHLS